MSTKEQFENRHKKVKATIIAFAAIKSSGRSLLDMCSVIGKNLDITPQTVYNYTKGRIRDGYLADAILKEIKKYKSK